MIINIRKSGYTPQPHIAPELMVYYNGKKIDNLTLNIDGETLKLETAPLYDISCMPYDEKYINENRSYYPLDNNSSMPSGMHLMADENYLYIWTGKTWKRTMLSDWDNH